jgi:TPP-dependent pyruvate/acetoin dehydrogenase alpha subunit/nucleoside-diphosphate-sugar epimerase
MNLGSRIYVAGHRGLVGSALCRRLQAGGYRRLLTRSRAALELTCPDRVEAFFARARPEYVFLAAARVGGIGANEAAPAEFIAENLKIQSAVLEAAQRHGVQRLIFFGSNCIYPRECPQPMREEAILTGPLEPSSQAYAVAKIAGLQMCEAFNRQHGTRFVSVIPATLYGPGDRFEEGGHVLAALMRKFADAIDRGGPVTVWGDGSAVREFLFVEDLVDACVRLMEAPDAALEAAAGEPALRLNVGSGEGVRIADLARLIGRVVGFSGEIRFDASGPQGAPCKILTSDRMRALGWAPRTGLEEGIRRTWEAMRPAAASRSSDAREPLAERLYRSMRRIRRVEEELSRLYPTDRIKSAVHLSIGQEPVAAGVCEALAPQDVVFGSYRSHAMYLAKGGDLKRMIAELYGKVGGCARGKGGSMHLIDTAHGVMGASAIVAATIPQAVGYAYALRLRRRDAIVVSFFGDGAVDEGDFHEAANFAALKELPVLFVCENNFYAIHSHHLSRHRSDNLCERARSYGMPAERLEGNDPLEIFARVAETVRRMREERAGPAFIECMTWRWKKHVGPGDDYALGYRTEQDARPWIEADAVARLGARLDAGRRRRLDEAIEREIREAFEFAEASPFPQDEELFADVFKEP